VFARNADKLFRTVLGRDDHSESGPRRAVREAELDQHFVREFASAILQQFPRCPAKEATHIAEHACRKYSGRILRSAAAKQLDPEAIRLAMIASVRHRFTDYDLLLLRASGHKLAEYFRVN
jgi:hypothetical protein